MTVTKQQVEELSALFERREALQQARDRGDKNFWIGVLNVAADSSPSRGQVFEAAGGRGVIANLIWLTVSRQIEAIQRELDAEIEKNGGQP